MKVIKLTGYDTGLPVYVNSRNILYFCNPPGLKYCEIAFNSVVANGIAALVSLRVEESASDIAGLLLPSDTR